MRQNSRYDSFNIHNELKREIKINRVAESDNAATSRYLNDNNRTFNLDARSRTNIYFQEFRLDSWQASSSSNPANGLFVWELANNAPSTQSRLGTLRPLYNVIELNIGNFHMPYPLNIPYFVSPDNSNSGMVLIDNRPNYDTTYTIDDYNSYLSQIPFKKITVEIKELTNQSVSINNGNRITFEYDISAVDEYGIVSAKVLNNGRYDTYKLSHPVNMNQISVILRNPDMPISFLPSYYTQVKLYPDENGSLNFTLRLPDGSIDKYMYVEDKIYITGYDKSIPSDNLYINRPEGHLISSTLLYSIDEEPAILNKKRKAKLYNTKPTIINNILFEPLAMPYTLTHIPTPEDIIIRINNVSGVSLPGDNINNGNILVISQSYSNDGTNTYNGFAYNTYFTDVIPTPAILLPDNYNINGIYNITNITYSGATIIAIDITLIKPDFINLTNGSILSLTNSNLTYNGNYVVNNINADNKNIFVNKLYDLECVTNITLDKSKIDETSMSDNNLYFKYRVNSFYINNIELMDGDRVLVNYPDYLIGIWNIYLDNLNGYINFARQSSLVRDVWILPSPTYVNAIVNGFYINNIPTVLRNSSYLIKITKGDNKDALLVVLNRVSNYISNKFFIINYNLVNGNFTSNPAILPTTAYLNQTNTNITFFQITKQNTIGNKIYLNPDINIYNYYTSMIFQAKKSNLILTTYEEFVAKYTGIVNIYIAKRRIRIPLKITQLDNKIDGKSVE
jgi:hypothetical protein